MRPLAETEPNIIIGRILDTTLLEKQARFQRYNMKCIGKHDTTLNIPRSMTFSPLPFMLYRGKSISFGTVYSKYSIIESYVLALSTNSSVVYSESLADFLGCEMV